MKVHKKKLNGNVPPVQNDEEFRKLENTNRELQDKLARVLADYANLDKRIERERQLMATLAITTIVNKMIDVLDDLYRAQEHLKDAGLQMAIDRFRQVLKSDGLEEINPVNEEFDPGRMECVDVVDGRANYVISVRKRGYKLDDHVIRPAQVVVGKEVNN